MSSMRWILVALVTALLSPPASLDRSGGVAPGHGNNVAAVRQQAVHAYATRPLSFEPNRGQAAGPFDFVSRGAGYAMAMASSEAVLALERAADGQRTILRTTVVGARPSAKGFGEYRLPGTVNYQIGNDSALWQTGLPTFAQVRYPDVYPGVDLVYYGSQGRLEYDFVVAPGADPEQVHLEFNGADQLSVTSRGDLEIGIDDGHVVMQAPVIYQIEDGRRLPVAGRYVVSGNRVAFAVDEYDRDKSLTIDPVLTYSTYFGGGNRDVINRIAIDSASNAYVVGQTLSTNLRTLIPAQAAFQGGGSDAFVAKFGPTGTLLYSTYIGGTGTDIGLDVDVDSAGAAHIVGNTDSSSLPGTSLIGGTGGGSGDGFVTKLTPAGLVSFTRILGGTALDTTVAVSVDPQGGIYLGGMSRSNDFPVLRTAVQDDAYLMRLTPTGTTSYVQILAGAGDEAVTDLVVDPGLFSFGQLQATGTTNSNNLPATPGYFQSRPAGGTDIFFIRISPVGTVLTLGLIGGTGNDVPRALNIDTTGFYFAGSTDSNDFPLTRPAQATKAAGTDAFIMKIVGQGQVYATYLGGSGTDIAYDIIPDGSQQAIAVGSTTSTDLPEIATLQDRSPGAEGFLVKMSTNGAAFLTSSYYGGSQDDAIHAVKINSAGSVFLAGTTVSSDFPVSSAAQVSRGGDADGFLSVLPESNFRPTNDDFDRAIAVTGPSGTISGTNTGATAENKEPLRGGTNTVWWKWSPPFTGVAQFDTIGSNFDTVLAVFRGTDVTTLSNVANDDDSGGNLTSLVNFTATQGVEYFIAVSGNRNAFGSIRLNWTMRLSPITGGVQITGLASVIPPGQQQSAVVRLNNPYPLPITGQLQMTFNSDAFVPVDDPTLRFINGTRIADFTIPANSLQAIFADNAAVAAFQTGTVSGAVTLRVTLRALGEDITPTIPAPITLFNISRGVPVITGLTINNVDDTNFEIVINGFATARQVTTANFTFAANQGVTLQNSFVQVDVGPLFITWYQSPESTAVGSQFVLRVPFNLTSGLRQGLGQVTVSLSNTLGTSGTSARVFQ